MVLYYNIINFKLISKQLKYLLTQKPNSAGSRPGSVWHRAAQASASEELAASRAAQEVNSRELETVRGELRAALAQSGPSSGLDESLREELVAARAETDAVRAAEAAVRAQLDAVRAKAERSPAVAPSADAAELAARDAKISELQQALEETRSELEGLQTVLEFRTGMASPAGDAVLAEHGDALAALDPGLLERLR